jgi:hypothetical protein
MRADLRKPPLGCSLETVEDRPGDGELEDAVSEKLEPLVGCRPVLGPRRVREDLLQPVCRQLPDEATELLRPGDLRLSPGAR